MKVRSRSPPTIADILQSPPPSSPISKRQEQNRAAQKAFRERRARLLKDMDERINHLESVGDVVAYQARRIAELDKEVLYLRQSLEKLEEAVDSLTMPAPLWSVPAPEGKAIPEPRVVVGALRPSSTDPTLDSTE